MDLANPIVYLPFFFAKKHCTFRSKLITDSFKDNIESFNCGI